MIDLHIHTKYSDGNNTVDEILVMAQDMGLNVISITDHDCCNAYYDLENPDIAKLFSGTIKKGIEITTAFEGCRIELLAYDFDHYELIDRYFKDASAKINWQEVMIKERIILLDKLQKLGIKYPEEFESNLLLDRFESKMYEEIKQLNDSAKLKEILKEFYCESGKDFFRKCIVNPNSPFYANYGKYRPKIDEIIKLVHDNGGLVFLAHPFGYGLNDAKSFIERLYDTHDLDGIECYYNGFTKEEIDYLVLFAKARNILISGGSDYHGTSDRDNELGKCMLGTSAIDDDIIHNWPNRYISRR